MVEPHQPFTLQQFPKVEPWQVLPEVPPQVASVETLRVEVGWAAELALVEEATAELALVEVATADDEALTEETAEDDAALVAEEDTELEPQFPKLD